MKKNKFTFKFKQINLLMIFLSIFLGLNACQSKTLLYIKITPESASLHVGQTQQFVATGFFSNGTTSNLTQAVTWQSSDETVVHITSQGQLPRGRATAQKLGMSQISAKYSSKTSNLATVTVMPQYAYIGDLFLSTTSITRCLVDINTGLFFECLPMSQSFFGPAGLATYRTLTQGFFYAANNGLGTGTRVSECNIVESSGFMSSCVDTGFMFGSPAGIDVSVFEGMDDKNNFALYVYVVNNGFGTVDRCLVDPMTGNFLSCTDSGAGIIGGTIFGSNANLGLISLNTVKNKTYAYIGAGFSGMPDVIKCFVSSTGVLSDCETEITSASPNDASVGVDFAHFGSETYAYVAQGAKIFGGPPAGGVSRCNVDATNGSLINCVDAHGDLDAAMNISILAVNGELVAYVSNVAGFSNSGIQQCKIDPITKDLSHCVEAGSGTGFSIALGQAFF